MKQKIQVIKTKLLAPKYKEENIRRAQLTKKLKTLSDYSLTIVHAGAGYGKSTALALYVHDERLPFCWYSISASDDDIHPFLTYIISSIQTIVPNFATELSEYLSQIDPYISKEQLNTLSSLFINEAVSINHEITIVLDDYHHVEHSYQINYWMEMVIEHLPDHFHFILLSRSRPGWKSLLKMKTSHQFLEITKDDLVFTKDEVALLLLEYYDISLTQEHLNKIYDLTEGWAIALGLIAQQLHDNQNVEAFIQKSMNTIDHLFPYLASEVFEKQPPLIQEFLEQTSVFEELDQEICETVLGFTNTVAILQQISEQNLFIQKMDDHQYRYHALFKEFLETQLKKHHPHQFQLLHERCGRYYETRKRFELALFHFQKINDYQASAALLTEYGIMMLESGKLESLNALLTKIPEEVKDRYFHLWFLQGEVFRYRSLYQEAETCYDKAIIGAEKKGKPREKSRALEGKAKIYLDTIQPDIADHFLHSAIEILEKSHLHSEADAGKLYQLLAENLLNLGEALKAEKWMKLAQKINGHQVDLHLEARLYLRTGRIKLAQKTLLEKKQKLQIHLPQSHRETDLLLALIEVLQGNGLKAKRLAQVGINYGMKINSPFVEACGWIRMGHAVQILEQYEQSLAIQCYETALKIMDDLHIDRGKAEPLMGLCLLYGRNGDYDKAIEAGNRALKETEKVKDLWLSSLITLSMGIAAVYHLQNSEAIAYIKKAEKMFRQCYDEYGKMLSYLWLAYCTEGSDHEKYIDLLLKQVEKGKNEFIFYHRTIFGPKDLRMFAPMLINAGKRISSSSFFSKLLANMNLLHLNSHPGYTLRIKTLGSFRVWLGENEVEERAWQREKAKELLQLFTTSPFTLFPKEEIFHKLWPNLDGKSAATDFKVALNALNKVLEPNRKARETPFFIKREGSAYGLNFDAGIELDSVLFGKWVGLGFEEEKDEYVIQSLENGLQMYKGDYLRDRRYEDWCLNERERLQVLFLRAAEKLAQLYVRKEDYEKAIYWCENILEKDSTWEEAYRLLMFCYYRKNNRPYAIKWYKKCCKVLEDELGVPPLDPTRHMYEMILSAEQSISPL
ncbi:BTAD domain-containing putative transcriptional regulator [Bacillus sp. B15-48]|uniref:BTAD domain-containing putative transcriptional regulator n=1 Tax=Bacillus sp. B15-48 TaxID=1548601 RepID=UPI00193FCDB9|nr:BTAD domain-containing putative transcriptional regulator [Bacillus sp. B15-48]MBM4763529.1 transcriptional regulator [Bacillus sp. B15-48]